MLVRAPVRAPVPAGFVPSGTGYIRESCVIPFATALRAESERALPIGTTSRRSVLVCFSTGFEMAVLVPPGGVKLVKTFVRSPVKTPSAPLDAYLIVASKDAV